MAVEEAEDKVLSIGRYCCPIPHESRGAHALRVAYPPQTIGEIPVCAGLKLAAASCRFPPADRNRFFSSRLACSTARARET